MRTRQATNRHATGKRQERDRQRVDVPTAAKALGITPDAVRSRLHRGTLDGERGPRNQWIVLLPVSSDTEPTDGHTTGNRQETDGHDSPALLAAKDELIAALSADLDFIRGELTASRQALAAERERFDVIHREALQRIEALTTGDRRHDDSDVADDDTAQDQRRAATVAQDATQPLESTSMTSVEPSIVASWLRRLLRGP